MAMTKPVLSLPAIGAAFLSVSACSPATDSEIDPADASETPFADGRADAGMAEPPVATPTAQATLAKTMPVKLRGDWHKDDLGRAPTPKDCDPRLRGTIDWDRLITVDEGGYSYFEMGGRITTVHRRTDTMIDATFDTTYADTPTSERRDFALQPDGTMAVNRDDGDGVMEVTQYRPCPSGGA